MEKLPLWHQVRTMRLVCAAIVTLFAITLTSGLYSQTTKGEILGRVTDPSGSVVAAVEITITEVSTGFKRTTVSHEDGTFSAPYLDPGQYRISAEVAGFKKFLREPIVLDAGTKVRVDIGLVIGETSQQLVVESAPPVIQSESGQIGETLSYQTMINVVQNYRTIYDMMLLSPGVMHASGYNIYGSRGTANTITIDGIAANITVTREEYQDFRLEPEALSELRISGVNNSAEYGSAGVVAQTTKGGTNSLHGQATWSQENGALGARNFFAEESNRGVPYNTWTFDIGGPIVIPRVYDGHNRTFFFFHHEGEEYRVTSPWVYNFPTAAMRQGDFSQLADVTIVDPTTGKPFPGNKIPAARLNPSALQYMGRFIPAPTFDFPDPVSNYNESLPNGSHVRGYNWRVDHQFGQKNTLWFRQFYKSSTGDSLEGPLPEQYYGKIFSKQSVHSLVLTDTHIFSPRIVNDFRIGFNRYDYATHGNNKGKDITDLMGLTGFPEPLDPQAYGVPAVTFVSVDSIQQSDNNRQLDQVLELINNLTVQRSRHSLKIGGEWKHSFDYTLPVFPSMQFGEYDFNGFATGNDFADFLLGIPKRVSRASAIGPSPSTQGEWALFVQDSWSVTPRLSLDLGLRYDRHGLYKEENNRVHVFDPATGGLVVPEQSTLQLVNPLFPPDIPIITAAEAGLPSSLAYTDKNDFAPRFGFAYRSKLWDLVLRGGYGVFYNFEAGKYLSNMESGPFTATETFDNTITGGNPLFAWPQAFPATAQALPLGVQTVYGMNAHIRSAYVQQWNLTLEKQIRTYGIRFSYVGSAGRQIPYQRNINRLPASSAPYDPTKIPYPIYRDIFYLDTGANSSYNAFQTELTRRFSGGFQITAHYTFARNISEVVDSSSQGGEIEDQYDRRRDKGEDYQPRQRFIAYTVWDIPVGRGRKYLSQAHPVLDGILGGWRLSTNFQANTGDFLTPTMSSTYDYSGNNSFGGRPDRVCDGNLRPNVHIPDATWFDTTCFVNPPPGAGRYGNSGRGVIVGPKQWGVNTGIFKYFNLPGEMKLQVRGLFKNILNHPVWGGVGGADPEMNISNPSAGIFTTTAVGHGTIDMLPQRNIELGLRLEF